ncbi:tetratricopeptide repeat protein [Falsiroseomonas selenitidurans]|uniref:Tetratricopeptide repeat protein n=1 Tax=Falsiroseomonas selenitidurans TaxID=2716335 RepID=A0ABX1E2C3_9PROT|nr:tetratricopeptide repeat protein [Falsiroseomonas selenitidurans]NKC31324.1 tetratricopeptide repeat protein [Falsiroseomonas selenitidurans]
MAPDLILHIGQSKTGTSSIQRVLGARRPALAKLGVCYPAAPGWANHGMLPASLVSLDRLGHFNPALWEGIGAAARLDRFRRDFAAEMAALPATTRLIILSAEQCGGLLNTPEEVGRLRDLLAPLARRLRVVVYLRRQDQHFASGYTQALRIAQINPPTMPQAGPERLGQYDYARLLDLWAGIFGADALLVRIFERDLLRNGDAVDDFLALCGIDLAVPQDDPDRQSNLSLTPGGIDLLRSMGAWMKATPQGLSAASPLWRRFVQAASETLPGRGWRPHPAEAAAFLGRFEAVNEAVRRRWFPDRPRLFAPLEVPEGPPPGAGPPPVDQAAALQAALALLEREMRVGAEREANQHAAIGRLHERLGESGPARTAYRAALRAVPDHPVAQQQLAEMALADGDRTTAMAHLAVLQRAHPDQAATRRLAQRLGTPAT